MGKSGKCDCCGSAIHKCFLGGRDGDVSGTGEVLVVEMVIAWYYW